MGTIKDDSGITVQLYDKKGKPVGQPYFGRHVHIAGKAQDEITRNAPLKDDEIGEPGSADWLTLVAVASTKSRLAAILKKTTVRPLQPSQSSHSSRRVLVEVHVGKVRRTFKDRITVASGPILSLDPKDVRIKVVHIKVLPSGGQLRDGHPLFAEFKGGKPAPQ